MGNNIMKIFVIALLAAVVLSHGARPVPSRYLQTNTATPTANVGT